jgi:predicted nicotinamide N-methyase
MALTSRIALEGPPAESPEDFFGASLGVIFEDDVMNQHGDDEHSLVYTSPHLPRPLRLQLADARADADRRLFSHYLWNASLQLAELIEAGTLGLPDSSAEVDANLALPASHFDVAGLTTAELGAGTALPSLMAALLGACRVLVTDYPAPVVMDTLRVNMATNVRPELSPLRGDGGSPDTSSTTTMAATDVVVEVDGHAWGELDTPLAQRNRRAFDRVFVCDCLWMPWHHANLRHSIDWFLRDGPGARCWVVAGFHTGRDRMAGFFDEAELRALGLEVDRIWERDCNGVDRDWKVSRGIEDVSERKRWLVIAALKRCVAALEPDVKPEGSRNRSGLD